MSTPMPARRICSLLPSATETLFALGLDESIVAVSHECDFPPQAKEKPVVLHSAIDGDASGASIDLAVRDALDQGAPLYRLDVDRLRPLQPDLVVSQDLCHVCAIDTATIATQLHALTPQPELLALHPHTLDEVLDDIRHLGERTGRGEQAELLVDELRQRIARVERQVAGARTRPRVVCLEWLDPLMATGHWIPEMVSRAGGDEVLGRRGGASQVIDWEAVESARPEVLVVMPCGMTVARAKCELEPVRSQPEWSRLPAVRDGRVYVVDANAYFTRPGPRLVDGIELLAAAFHPDVMRATPSPQSVERLAP